MGLVPGTAVAIGVLSLGGGWVIDDLLCKSWVGKDTLRLAGVGFVLLVAAAYGYTHVFGAVARSSISAPSSLEPNLSTSGGHKSFARYAMDSPKHQHCGLKWSLAVHRYPDDELFSAILSNPRTMNRHDFAVSAQPLNSKPVVVIGHKQKLVRNHFNRDDGTGVGIPLAIL